jgi:hypothetical protein
VVGVIEIEEPPDQRACASCAKPVNWLWSYERKAWVAFVPGPDQQHPEIHGCRHAQDPPTWRDIRPGDPPSEVYVDTRNKIKETRR